MNKEKVEARYRSLNALASIMCEEKNKEILIERAGEIEYMDVLNMLLNSIEHLRRRRR